MGNLWSAFKFNTTSYRSIKKTNVVLMANPGPGPITRDPPVTKKSAFAAVNQNNHKPRRSQDPKMRSEVNRQQQEARVSDTPVVSQLSDHSWQARSVLKMKKARGVLKMKNRLALERTSLRLCNAQGRPAKKSKWIVQERTCSRTSGIDVVDGSKNQILLKSPGMLTFINSLDEITNSRERASKLFEWLIAPLAPDIFFSKLWETKPLLLRRHNPDYYRGLFSMEEFDRILHKEDIQFGVNIDVTSFSEDKRETHNGSGRAYPSVLWDYFQNGCSLRMLNPQSYSATLWKLLSLLQEHFGSMAGANVYVTPAGTQGFAPHYDDIEAFVLQIEGRKCWRLYDQSEDDRLPRFSSKNFSQEELNHHPILEAVLEPGDVLYFPRGFVHQANCQPSTHSLHITISTFQRNTYGDLLEKLLPQTLQSAIEQDVELRRGLPRDLLHFMGVEHTEKVDPRRKVFQKTVRSLMDKIFDNVPLDAAVDQFAKGFLHDCLPPPLTKRKMNGCTVYMHSRHTGKMAKCMEC
uniref:ribosomal oxygenase 1-like isoform X2 n=1 Tax=Myxine glutinosa TaxID=7769 RepID=UPI00358EBB8B